MKIELEIDDTHARLLAVLADDGDVKAVLAQLIDHAQQGVYRPGAWEREWLSQAFGEEWQSRLEPGDPYGREGGWQFERPITPVIPCCYICAEDIPADKPQRKCARCTEQICEVCSHADGEAVICDDCWTDADEDRWLEAKHGVVREGGAS